MKIAALAAALATLLVVAVGCDEKKEGATTASSATPSATAPAASSAPATTAAERAAPTASAAASASAGAPTSTKDPAVSVLDPKSDPQKSVKAQIGGTVTLYLPQWAGTSWKVTQFPKPLGKAKEEVIPGFAGPSTPAAGFVWKLNDPSLKAGQSFKVNLENKSSADKAAAPQKFTLTIDLVAA